MTFSGLCREGESYELDEPSDSAVVAFTVVESTQHAFGYVHRVLVLESTHPEAPAGSTYTISENEHCAVFSHFYKRIGSDLPKTG